MAPLALAPASSVAFGAVVPVDAVESIDPLIVVQSLFT